ncbi:MAG TPA: hypothetical protein VE641_08410 [Chthoniobacterales bacterium]|nr:hypothetical protein [Chthoniobacterales bacterium]
MRISTPTKTFLSSLIVNGFGPLTSGISMIGGYHEEMDVSH